MVLVETSGTVTTDGAEDTIIDVETVSSAGLWLYLNPMVSGDQIQIKQYKKDIGASTFRVYRRRTYPYSFSVNTPAIFCPFLPGKGIKVTITRTAGADHTYNWDQEVY